MKNIYDSIMDCLSITQKRDAEQVQEKVQTALASIAAEKSKRGQTNEQAAPEDEVKAVGSLIDRIKKRQRDDSWKLKLKTAIANSPHAKKWEANPAAYQSALEAYDRLAEANGPEHAYNFCISALNKYK